MNQVLAAASCGGSTTSLDTASAAGFTIVIITFVIAIFVVVLAVFGFWLWMLIDAANREEAEYKKIGNGDKTVWVLALVLSVIFGFSFVVSLLYYFLVRHKAVGGKPKKKK